MRLEEVKKKVEAIQKRHSNLTKLTPMGEVYEPGKTGYLPKSGTVLINAIFVNPRVRAIQVQDNQLTTDDFYGMHPRIGLVMESGSAQFEVGNVVLLGNQIRMQDVVINGTIAALVYESDLLGIDTNYDDETIE